MKGGVRLTEHVDNVTENYKKYISPWFEMSQWLHITPLSAR